jgi:uncharacterized membrane protein
MLYQIPKFIHMLAVIVWIGGMVYTLFFLRPAIGKLAPADRVTLMHDVLGRFFSAVLAASTLAVFSGLWMVGRVARATVQSGGNFSWPTAWIVMAALGVVMFLIFGHIRFALYKRLKRAVEAKDWSAGGATLTQIRLWVSVNLALGLAIIACVYLLR